MVVVTLDQPFIFHTTWLCEGGQVITTSTPPQLLITISQLYGPQSVT